MHAKTIMLRCFPWFVFVAILMLQASCAPHHKQGKNAATESNQPVASAQPASSTSETGPSRFTPYAKANEHGSVHNVIEVAPGLISGSVPKGETGFAELKRRGVRTVLSVDGATPDVLAAHRFGMRYAHLPIGYHGIDHQRQLEIARAVRELPSPVYVHCHHGKHRGPAAAASAAVALGLLSAGDAIAFMKQAGTSDNYVGLYRCVQTLEAADAGEWADVSAEFPEVAPVPGFVKAMAQTQDAYDHLVEIRDAGWRAPQSHPDLVPLAEAGHLENLLRALQDDPERDKYPGDFTEMLRESWFAAQQFESELKRRAPHDELQQRLSAINNSCMACHAIYRNNR